MTKRAVGESGWKEEQERNQNSNNPGCWPKVAILIVPMLVFGLLKAIGG